MAQWSVERSDAGSGEATRGTGEADEGRVRVTVVDERLETVRVEARLLRSSREDLSRLLIEAVNAALADFRAQRPGGEISEIDLREVIADLQKANEEFHRGTNRDMEFAADVIADLREAGVKIADLPILNTDDMLDELIGVLRTVDEARNLGEEDLTGTGEAPRGAVRAVCVPSGRLASLVLDARAMRGTVELEQGVVAAVNAALDDLAAKTRDLQAEADIDPEAVKKQLGQLRERNVARLESYFRALSDVINGIEPER
ncbi:hypothetical protein GCM10023191_059650 [Actinoallomurus oryzae]|uniref:Uncharacterized protein n=1 Tax=Actinoallomurus oryzae TaxID=502180 RepID=A0ABP8QKY9_9ACTN